jgi:predicted  nucleic acid-binding Zn-ribbon protein
MSNVETALERTFAILEIMKETLDSQVEINAQVMARLDALERDNNNHEDEIRSLVVDVGNVTDEITDLQRDIENLMLMDGNP